MSRYLLGQAECGVLLSWYVLFVHPQQRGPLLFIARITLQACHGVDCAIQSAVSSVIYSNLRSFQDSPIVDGKRDSSYLLKLHSEGFQHEKIQLILSETATKYAQVERGVVELLKDHQSLSMYRRCICGRCANFVQKLM